MCPMSRFLNGTFTMFAIRNQVNFPTKCDFSQTTTTTTEMTTKPRIPTMSERGRLMRLNAKGKTDENSYTTANDDEWIDSLRKVSYNLLQCETTKLLHNIQTEYVNMNRRRIKWNKNNSNWLLSYACRGIISGVCRCAFDRFTHSSYLKCVFNFSWVAAFARCAWDKNWFQFN